MDLITNLSTPKLTNATNGMPNMMAMQGYQGGDSCNNHGYKTCAGGKGGCCGGQTCNGGGGGGVGGGGGGGGGAHAGQPLLQQNHQPSDVAVKGENANGVANNAYSAPDDS